MGVYTCATSVLIKAEDSKSGAEEQLQELGIQQTSSNMTNEMLSLNTMEVAAEIVNRLDLETDYTHEGVLHDELVYGLNLPVSVRFDGLADNETATLTLTLRPDSAVVIEDMTRGGESLDGNVTLRLGQTADSPLGKITVLPSPYYRKGTSDVLSVSRHAADAVIASVQRRISAELRDKNSTIIDIRYKDVSVARAKDVLSTLVAVYNENWVKDRNRISVSTSEFIKERLGVIEQELGSVDRDISSYKSENLVPDVQQVSTAAMSQATEAEQQSRTIDNQLYMARYIRNYLLDGNHENQLLPANSGIENSSIEQQIGEYNETLLKRNKHLAISSAQNPLVMDLDQNLATMRRTIIHSLDNEVTMLQTQQRTVQHSHNQATAKIAANPKQAQYLLSVERQQKVKESLYLFLLQKREENELSQAFTAYNTRLLEPPHVGSEPAEPVNLTVMLVAFLLGLAVPAAVIFVRENLNTNVRGRKDLEKLKMPFVGEIPYAGTGKKKRHRHSGAHQPTPIQVEASNHNSVNEAFRLVRTNIEFMLGYDGDRRVIMLTSIHPDSGKTFISVNLATAFALKDKRVILLDLDLRKGSLSRYADRPNQGLSNYLSGQASDYVPLLKHVNSVDILPCGTLPPNPAELLFSPRLRTLLDELRQQYDYIIMDCPPLEVVADAAILNPYADLTLFVIRSQMFDRSLLPEVEEWYETKKYKNLSVILNGTTESYGRYGYHRYGYHRYGYHYGYGNDSKK